MVNWDALLGGEERVTYEIVVIPERLRGDPCDSERSFVCIKGRSMPTK